MYVSKRDGEKNKVNNGREPRTDKKNAWHQNAKNFRASDVYYTILYYTKIDGDAI